MPADRFFLSEDLETKSHVSLGGPEHHHLAHVMKRNEGDVVELVNGRGDLALGKILALNKKHATIQILKKEHEEESLKTRILLGIPLMRASKLEWIVEKGVEIGVDAFLFYPAAHSELTQLSPRHLERLHTLSVSALKQSGRLYLPPIEILPTLTSLLKKEALLLFGDLHALKTIEPKQDAPTILFISGPERGFSPEENTLLTEKARGVLLSRYTLRAETAPIVAASILQLSK